MVQRPGGQGWSSRKFGRTRLHGVFTDTISMLPPDTRTVEVTILVGFVTSFLAYTSPRLQVFPVTLTTSSPFITTVRGQPIGQPIHVNFLSSIVYASSIFTVMVCRSGYFRSCSFVSLISSISPGATTGRFLWITLSSSKYALI